MSLTRLLLTLPGFGTFRHRSLTSRAGDIVTTFFALRGRQTVSRAASFLVSGPPGGGGGVSMRLRKLIRETLFLGLCSVVDLHGVDGGTVLFFSDWKNSGNILENYWKFIGVGGLVNFFDVMLSQGCVAC